ncbi:hypothetical protein HHI36_013207 [Cryptolaemus montrouzieri]|uniref:Uncharacterized protein n=1 Tax=Cryptolaemus montrouzieri TaxID=559131 RepID=A0ABD2NGE5_9CUCU
MGNVIPGFMGPKNASILNKMLSLRYLKIKLNGYVNPAGGQSRTQKMKISRVCKTKISKMRKYTQGGMKRERGTKNLETKLDSTLNRNKLILKKLDKIEKENKQLNGEVKQSRKENVEMRSEIDSLKTQKRFCKIRFTKEKYCNTGFAI